MAFQPPKQIQKTKIEPAPKEPAPLRVRAVYGRMLDLYTGREYITTEAREAIRSDWLTAQLEAKKLVLE